MRFELWLVALAMFGCFGDDDGPSTPRRDAAAATIDADPACASQDSIGGFPTCTVCDAIGAGCDTIDDNGQISRVCDCTAPCPCGTHCGDYEIAPGIVIGNICIR